MQGSYKMGQPDGEFKWWYSNGQIQGQGSYENGDMAGPWVWWHENGMKMVTGAFANNVRSGIWSRWDSDGRIVYRLPASEIPDTESADGAGVAMEIQASDSFEEEPLRISRRPRAEFNSTY